MTGPFVEMRSDDHEAFVRLAYDPVDQDFGTLIVEIRAGGLSCDGSALTLRGDGLESFLAELAADWRGWKGTRTWDAIEGEMTIEATHRGNRVELLFILRRDYEPDAWEVRLPLLIAPGESLSQIAKAGHHLFSDATRPA